jgi:hypothetical protein
MTTLMGEVMDCRKSTALHARTCGLLLAGMAVLAVPGLGWAQFGPPPPSVLTPKVAPTGVVLGAANALGMVHGNNDDNFDSINRIQFIVAGTEWQPVRHGPWPQFKVTRAVISLSYHQAAGRWDIQRSNAQGQSEHLVEVVAGGDAWNETSPGVGGVAAMATAPGRTREIWLTPTGFMAQAILAGPDRVKVGKQGDANTLGIVLHGEPITATLDAQFYPVRIEAQVQDPVLGKTTLTYEYSDYKKDPYKVAYPTHIVKKLGGRTVLDLNVTDFYTGPYFLFDRPEGLAAGGGAK